MRTIINHLSILMVVMLFTGCNHKNKHTEDMGKFEKGTFGYDVNYLSQKDEIVVLSSRDKKSQVLVSPGYQGKVFTSTVDGMEGASLGYLNYDVLESETLNEHMNGYGGENRLWLGPEGGKFSIYFKPGVEQVYENWHTPAPIDTESWTVLSKSASEILMKKEMQLENYQGTKFNTDVRRSIKIVEPKDIPPLLDIEINENIKAVGYLTENSLTNLNSFEWTTETGTICIWMLDMYQPSPNSFTIIPFHEGTAEELGKIATTDYFGEIPAERLKIKDGVMFLKTDGKNRNKLGINALRTKAIAGNYDPDTRLLTITLFDVKKEGTYLNQEWNPDKDPLIGDAMNAYNDGPLEDGSIMGPFFEIESASPAAFLKPGESLTHQHNVFHFSGEEKYLDQLTISLMGVSIDELKKIFR